MADVKISGLPASTVPLAGTEVLPIVQGGTTKQVSVANLTAGRAIAATSITTDTYKAASSSGGALQNSGGTPQLQWGAGGGNNLSVDVAININPANAQVAISPTGTGSVTINPATAGTINNMSIGATTASTGAFSTLSASSTVSGTGFSTYLASPPAIGGTSAAAGNFTTLGATGVTTVQAGSVSAPAITTSGDTNTGIFFPAADTIAFSEGGAESMRITSTGDLLVGATTNVFNPKLGVTSSTAFPFAVVTSQVGGAVFNKSTDGAANQILMTSNNNFNYGAIGVASADGTANGDLFTLGYTPSAGSAATQVLSWASTRVVTMGGYGAGTATFSAAGVISSVSDETWKTKDGVPSNPDEMIQKLEPGYWFYNEEKAPFFGTDRQLGFYAQNVNEAIGNEAAPTPETYVENDENGVEVTKTKPWGYYVRSVLAVAVMSLKNALNSIQEQQTLIENLTTRLDALEARLTTANL
jgi:hypothetical protein